MAIFAYIRVSTSNKGQTTDNQRKLITDAGFTVDEFFSEDGVSGSVDAINRPAFADMMSKAKEGDTCIVTMVDRLGRSAVDILHTVEEFKRLGIRLRVLQFDAVDITSSMGKMLVTLMSAFAELERNTIIERIHAGLARAKEAGTIVGPPLKIAPKVLYEMQEDRSNGYTLDKLVAKYNVSRSTLANNLNKWKDKMDEYEAEYNQRESQYALKQAA